MARVSAGGPWVLLGDLMGMAREGNPGGCPDTAGVDIIHGWRCNSLRQLTGKGCYRKVPCSSGSSTEAQMLHW
jgi:hypothetical protein